MELKVLYHAHSSTLLVPVTDQINLVRIIPCFYRVRYNFIFTHKSGILI
jgi:hypothetical protein